MLTEQTQKIMGYFIEEAKDHLNIIEQGLLNLQQTLEDPELLQEIFRAAHSVKGGAAMLGIESVRDTAHKLEDTFKVLKDNSVEVDGKLESLSIAVFDTLQEAVEMLSEETGLTEEEEKYILKKVNPVFRELEEHLKTLNEGGNSQKNRVLNSINTMDLEENDLLKISTELDDINVAEEEDFSQIFAEPINLNGTKTMPKKGSTEKESRYTKEQGSALDADSLTENKTIDELDDWFNELESFDNTDINKPESFVNSEIRTGPAVGIAELNTLADLFEGDAPDLDANWEEEEILNSSNQDFKNNFNLSDTEDYDSGDLTDILFGEDDDYNAKEQKKDLSSLSSLFEETEEDEEDGEESQNTTVGEGKKQRIQQDSSSESLEDLFGDFKLEEELPAPELVLESDDSSEELEILLKEFPEVETSSQGAANKIKKPEKKEEKENVFADLLPDNWGDEASMSDGSIGELFDEESITEPKIDDSQQETDTESMDGEESSVGDFNDLEDLLENDTSLVTESKEEEEEEEKDTEEEDFASLEAMLEDGSNEELPAEEEPEEEDFGALESLLSVSDEEGTLENESEEDFDDLESLLKDEKENAGEKSTGGKPQQVEIDFSDLDKLVENMDADTGRNTSVSAAPTQARRSRAPREQTIKVPAKQLDNLSNLMGELVVNRNSLEQGQERMRQFLDNLLHQVMLLGDVGQQMQDLYERTLLEQTIWKSRSGHRNSVSDSPTSAGDLQSKNEKGLSEWELDTFTPFHEKAQTIIEQIVRVRESASDIEFLVEEADQVTRQLRQVTNQLQEGLTKARMVPFAQTSDRLPRAVWEVSRNCGKEAELVVEGKDSLIDKMIQEQLYDPMTHLVNNAITHGIEMPKERVAAGKPQKGRITIRAFHQGNQTVISVADDGGGIDPAKVKKKAIEKGLISRSQSENMSNLDAYDLLFHPGFSTVETANKFAGRGVGMDVVRTKLNEIRGTITIDSTIGKGTVFTIRLPLTLSISRALCCISDRSWIAFPMDGVEDMIKVSSSEVEVGPEGQQYIQWRGTKLPFRHLRELLVYNRQMRRANVYGINTEEDVISVVVLRSAATGSSLLAVQVDQVLEQQKEVVIKQLQGPVPKPMGIAGATVLGDGKIVAIADTIELMNLASGKLRREDAIWSPTGDEGQSGDVFVEEQKDPTVLIVDDSITVRELLSMTFTKAGYRVEQARDGKDAWEKLRSGLPCDLIFCDIEMPRMDGLELLSRVQKDAALSKLPMAMLTSRGASKHRQMAYDLGASGYFTKPYLEDHLLDAAGRMLDGEVVGLTPAGA